MSVPRADPHDAFGAAGSTRRIGRKFFALLYTNLGARGLTLLAESTILVVASRFCLRELGRPRFEPRVGRRLAIFALAAFGCARIAGWLPPLLGLAGVGAVCVLAPVALKLVRLWPPGELLNPPALDDDRDDDF